MVMCYITGMFKISFSLSWSCISFWLLSSLTSHGTEPEELVGVIVVGGTTPFHAVTAPIRGAVAVVAPTVEEGEVAQASIGVPTSGCNDDWIGKRTCSLIFFPPCLLQIKGCTTTKKCSVADFAPKQKFKRTEMTCWK